ncbi:MAG: hypothetical protein Q4A34_00135 [Candidatus Saccharibacteria bacterium]|nr:hypothetical protein [Candidatus Saccharibacteria bacterium]
MTDGVGLVESPKLTIKHRWSFLDKAWLSLMAFWLIFAPPVIPQLNSIMLLGIVTAVLLAVGYRDELRDLLNVSVVRWALVGMTAFTAYAIVVGIINMVFGEVIPLREHIMTVYRFGLLMPVAMTTVIYMALFAKRRGYDYTDILEIVLWAGVLQVVLAIIAAIIPQFRTVLIDVMHTMTGDAIFTNKYYLERRFFGFANNMLDTFGYGVGIITGIVPIVAALRRRWWYILFLPGFFFALLMNARTGVVVALIGLIITVIWLLLRGGWWLRAIILGAIGAVLLLVPVGLEYMRRSYPKVYYSSMHDAGSVLNFLQSGDTASPKANGQKVDTTAKQLFSGRFWQLPEGIQLLFGSGHSVYGVDGYNHSDVGYINDIWLWGFVGMVAMFGSIIALMAMYGMRSSAAMAIAVFLIVALLLFQVKGRAVMANAGFVATMIIVITGILLPRSRHES